MSREQELSAVLDRLFPSSDPLDDQDFDAVSYLNSQHFSGDLNSLAPFTLELKRRLEDLDREIDDGVKRASTSGTQAQRDVAEAKTAIASLAEKLKDIHRKSLSTSTSINDLCSDIKKLDQAKKNLTTAITVSLKGAFPASYLKSPSRFTLFVLPRSQALERMQMLST